MVDDKKYNKHDVIFSEFNKEEFIIAKRILPYRILFAQIEGEEPSSHRVIELIYVVKGALKVKVRNESFTLHKGDFHIISSDKVHSIYSETKNNIVLIFQICPDYLQENFGIQKYFTFSNAKDCIKNKDKVITALGLLYIESLKKEVDMDFHLYRLNLLMDSIRCYLSYEEQEDMSYKDTSVSLIWDIIENHSEDTSANLTLGEVSKTYNISYSYLSRKFKEVVGINFSDYFLKQKLNRVMDLLINSDKSITEIAFSTGFTDISVLNRNFKAIFNLSPTELRLKYKSKAIKNKFLQDQSVKDFIKKITQKNFENILVEDNSYNLNINNNYVGINKNVWGQIIDLSSIINIGIQNLETVFDAFKFKNIIIKLQFVEDDSSYDIKDNILKNLSRVEINRMVKILDNNNVIPIIRLDFISENKEHFYENEDEFLKKCKDKINSCLDFVSMLIGKLKLSKWNFEICVPDINSPNIDVDNYNIMLRHINNFVNILIDMFGEQVSWGVYIGYLNVLHDCNKIENMKKLKNLRYKPKFYSIDLVCNDNNYSLAIGNVILKDKSKSLINRVKDSLGMNDEGNQQNLLISFNYHVINDKIEDKYNIIYSNLFLKNTLVNMRQSNLYVTSCNVISGESKIINHNMFYNTLGISLAPLYISKFIQQLKKEIIFVDDGCIITKEAEDIAILLYTNYNNSFQYKFDLFKTDNIKFKNKISLNISGVKGKYKVTEYQIDYKKSLFYNDFIKHINTETMNEEEEYYIKSRTNPDMIVKFLNLEGELKYLVNLNLLGISFIKLEKL